MVTNIVDGPVVDEHIERFDDIVRIELKPNNPTVGRYVVYFTAVDKIGSWSVGHPDSYVKYGGVMYRGEAVEKLRNLLERKKISAMLEKM